MSSITLQSVAQSRPLPNAPYIYALYSNNIGLFSIASDDVLRCSDPSDLRLINEIKDAHEGITCLSGLETGDGNLSGWSGRGKGGCVVTAGRNGCVRAWDLQSSTRKPVFEAKTEQNTPLSALACDASQNAIAAGAEVEVSGRQADIYIWDIRNPSSPVRTYTESHTDTITTLSFAPIPGATASATTLLSGSTDGLLALFDPAQNDEDDAVLQVFNLGSAVHKAGFLAGQVWATSSDEAMSFFEMSDPSVVGEGRNAGEGKGVQDLGDVRELVECRYVVNVGTFGNHASDSGSIVVGDSTRNHLALYPIRHESDSWSVRKEGQIIFDGAHGDEVVRDFVFRPRQGSYGMIYTCGEDGLIKAWRSEDGGQGTEASIAGEEMDVDMEAEVSKPKRRKW